MAGQDKSKVSSIIKDTLTDSKAGAAEILAAPASGLKTDVKNKQLEHDLLEHAYALISFAKNEGIEPSELLAKILASGRLMLFENNSSKNHVSSSAKSAHKTNQQDPDELNFFDDDLKELVF